MFGRSLSLQELPALSAIPSSSSSFMNSTTMSSPYFTDSYTTTSTTTLGGDSYSASWLSSPPSPMPAFPSLQPFLPSSETPTMTTTYTMPNTGFSVDQLNLFPPLTVPPSTHPFPAPASSSTSWTGAFPSFSSYSTTFPAPLGALSFAPISGALSVPAPLLGSQSVPASAPPPLTFPAAPTPQKSAAPGRDFALMSFVDLVQAARELEAEAQRWRELEQARLEDDTDPATVKSFLRMANEEVERLRKREAELQMALRQSSSPDDDTKHLVENLRRREAQLSEELRTARSAQAEVKQLRQQLEAARKKELFLTEQLRAAHLSASDIDGLQAEVDTLRKELQNVRALYKQRNTDASRSSPEVQAGPPRAERQREAPYFGVELADGVKYSKDYTDDAEAFGKVKVVRAIGPAESAGLRPGDMITSLNGTPVRDLKDFNRIATQVWAGDIVSVQFERNEHPLHTVIHTEHAAVKRVRLPHTSSPKAADDKDID